MTEEKTKEAERFNNQLAALRKNSDDLARSLVGELLPALNQLLEKKNNEGFFALFGFDAEFKAKKELAAAADEVLTLNKRATIPWGSTAGPRGRPFLKNGLANGFYGPQFQKELDETNAKLGVASSVFATWTPHSKARL